MDGLKIVNNTGEDLRWCHDAIVTAIRNDGKLPEELVDVLSLTKITEMTWRIDFA